MQIPVNKNIDQYKDDFFKGMTMRQSVFGIATVTAGSVVFLFFYLYLKLPVMPSVYLMLPVALPVAIAGFLRIDGKTPGEYLKLRGKTVKTPLYRYSPIMLQEPGPEELIQKDRKPKRMKDKGNKIYLQVESDGKEEGRKIDETEYEGI